MNERDLTDMIGRGESVALEFKSASVRPESLARELCAFSNGAGGTILIGVEDDGTVTGLSDAKEAEERVMNIARTLVAPAIAPEAQSIGINGKVVLSVTVPKGPHKPYQTNDGRFMIRVGSSNRQASQAELMRLFQLGGIFHYDAVELAGTSVKDLAWPKVAAWFEQYAIDFMGESPDEQERLLRHADIMGPEGNVTVAGMMLFGVFPQRHVPNACISFARFAGADVDGELLDRKVVEGTIDMQVDAVLTLCRNSQAEHSVIEGNRRSLVSPLVSDKVIRELLVNAVVHRDYSIQGSRIRVFMFADRFEVRSPGRLPNTVSPEKMLVGVSYASNPVILKFMENLRYVDKLGRGIPLVARECRLNAHVLQLEEIGDEFVVRIVWRGHW